MDKLKMHSPDLVSGNIERLAELFPGCVTESQGEDGRLERSIDFDLLRQELSDHVVEGPQERYRLDWPGKREALLAANAPIAKTLRPCREESVDFDTTRNLFIEGDNLDALKLLQETYLGQVKLMFIDPPYNTGDDFLYEDDFSENSNDFLARSRQTDAEGIRLVTNTESSGRFHSDWMSMMYSRLKLARNLLKDDGAIFVCIDFNEFSNLKKLMDEVFGEENFQRQIIWRIGWLSGFKTTAQNFIRNHDVILFYTKNHSEFEFNKHYIQNSNFKALVKKEPKISEFMDNLGLGQSQQKDLLNFINHENRPDRYPIEDTWNCNEYDDLNSIAIVSFSSEKISKILDIPQDFKGQKSIQMIKRVLACATSDDDIVMDFFAGTGSTAHAVLDLNAQDGGNRRHIMVQLPEPCEAGSAALEHGYPTISDISKERIRRSGRKVLSGQANSRWRKDTGFRVLKIDSSNMAEVYYRPDELKQDDLLSQVDNIRPGRTAEDLLFQVLLDWGVDLSLPITREDIDGREVFFVDGNALAACFVADGGVDEALVKQIAQRQPLRAVFRDAGFASDNARINVEQIFKAISPSTEVRTL